MKRIAFIIPQLDHNWTGGLNYYRSLLHAIQLQKYQRYIPVVIVAPGLANSALQLFPDIEVLSTDMLSRLRPLHIVRKLCDRIFTRDLLLERYLRQQKISISSHGPALGQGASIPNLCWVPDFQHRHLPQYFTADEIEQRKKRNLRLARGCSAMIVSSETAKADAVLELPEYKHKLRVLPFVPKLSDSPIKSLESLEHKFQFSGRYLFLPNQFWAHKNHRIIVDALSILKRQDGADVQVICTGSLTDYRNPSHFSDLSGVVKDKRLGSSIRILGVLPYEEMFSLMFHAHAIINPSKFEGWSTTVEEAKLLEKPLLLSSIPVHHEQAQSNACFFDGQDAQKCADALLLAWNKPSPAVRLDYQERAQSALIAFGQRFCDLLDATTT